MRVAFLRLIHRIHLGSGHPWTELIELIRKLLSNPQVAELCRFVFLGTIVETGRMAAQKIADFISGCGSSLMLDNV
jgi:hypothetical protein